MKILKFHHFLRSRRGISLVEVLIASAIFGVGAVGILSSMNFLTKGSRTTKQLSQENQQVLSLVGNISDNLNIYKTDYEPYDSSQRQVVLNRLEKNQLPIAWSDYSISTPQECPECPGRMGYVIKPINGVPGLFIVFLKVTHEELFDGGGRLYQFIATKQ